MHATPWLKILPNVFWLECEYAGIDTDTGLPASNREGIPLVSALLRSLPHATRQEINALWGIKEEVFRHQREIVTKKWSLQEVLQRAVILHEIIAEHMVTKLWVSIAPTSAPLPFPGGWAELLSPRSYYVQSMSAVNSKGHLLWLVTPKSYYLEAVEKIADSQPDDFSFAWNASTSSTHLHMSYDLWTTALWIKLGRNLVGNLTTKLIAKNSRDIATKPESRWRERGMSPERHAAWSKIVATRAKLGEVLDPLDAIIIQPGTTPCAYRFIADRYFAWADRNTDAHIEKNITPNRDHLIPVLKNPWWLTCELRSGDWPWNNSQHIETIVNCYLRHVADALTHEFPLFS